MKYLISLFALILIVSSVRPQAPERPPWNLYTVKGERFSLALPALPTLQTYKEMRMPSQKERRKRLVRCSIRGVVYSVQLIENIKPRLSLDAFIQEQARAYKENLLFERNLNIDGVAGKAFLYPDGQGGAQFFVTDDRLYEVRAYGAPADDPKIKTFFHYLSFRKQDEAVQISESVQASAIDTSTATIIKGQDADIKARLISKPEPTYTAKAKSEQINGMVVLKCIFAADGNVTNIRVVQGLPHGLTEAAIEAARKIKFIPAVKDGKNVSMWMQLEYNFNLY